jgi:hypothetical protein
MFRRTRRCWQRLTSMTPITDASVLARKADKKGSWMIDGDNAIIALKAQREASELSQQLSRIGDIDLTCSAFQ